MATKYQTIGQRVKIGNLAAEKVKDFLNSKFEDYKLEKSNEEEDKLLKIDYKCANTDWTFQFKVRETGDDFIYEVFLIHPKDHNCIEHAHKFNIKNGRDYECTAKYYVTKPSSKDEIYISKAAHLKKYVENLIFDFNSQCSFSAKKVKEWLNLSLSQRNKSFIMKKFDDGVEMRFKIDEGYGKSYAKILFFVPVTIDIPKKIIEMKENVLPLKLSSILDELE